MKNNMPKILTIGGGSGQFVLLSGLRDMEDIEITSVVSMADSGGSTGRLRDELGILPPGDALKCVIALSPFRDFAIKVMLRKLNKHKRLQGHNAGNMLLTMLSQYTGSFPAAIQSLSEILESRGRVLPATINKATLVAELTDGSRIYGESSIDIPQGAERGQISDIYLVPHHHNSISAYGPVVEAIENSDYIFIGPGDLFTSIIANLIVPGVKKALQSTGAEIIYILNIMTKFGETHNYQGSDFVYKVENYLGRELDGIICNSVKPPPNVMKSYVKEKAELVGIDNLEQWIGDRNLYADDLLDTSDQVVRHDPNKLASLIKQIICS
jgi:uncharacterized cofD-like protein